MLSPLTKHLLLLFAAGVLCPAPLYAQSRTPAPGSTPATKAYEFRLIDPPGAIETDARGINNDGIVVGDTATLAQFNVGSENGYVFKEHR